MHQVELLGTKFTDKFLMELGLATRFEYHWQGIKILSLKSKSLKSIKQKMTLTSLGFFGGLIVPTIYLDCSLLAD